LAPRSALPPSFAASRSLRSRLCAAMFCPHCHAEYRQGFTRCHDCDADLVYELDAQDLNARADASAPADTLHGLRVLWRDTSQEACVSLCYKLRDQSIPYKVKETAGSAGIDMRAVRRYELAASSDHYQRAKTVLQVNDDLPETISEDEWRKLERHEAPDQPDEEDGSTLPDEDGGEADGAGESSAANFAREQQLRREAYFRPWYPEDATAEIWSQMGDVDFSGAIEMALKESLIRCRLETEDAIPKVFVLPEQEIHARQIVREIIDGV
jgi:hypothetical protein